MTYLGIQTSIGRHGGGTHQWNLLYKDVQYGWRVSRAITEADRPSNAYLVDQLWRYDIQPRIVLHQALDSIIDPENILFGQARPVLLVDTVPDRGKRHLLHPLPVHPTLSLLTTEQNLESRRTRPLSRR